MSSIVTSLSIIIKDNQILLGKKKRGFGASKYNGPGGKVEDGESIEEAMLRETFEEVGITPTKYEKVGVVNFDEYYKGEKAKVTFHLFMVYEWDGDIKESDELIPKWFGIDKIPYEEMFEDDKYWLPLILDGKHVEAYFNFDEDWNLISKEIKEI